MFGNREMIDESSCDVIDETDYGMVDDIRDEKQRGGSHAGHLCDEGQSFHEAADRRASSAYNSTPRTSPDRQPAPKATSPYPQPSARSTSPYPKPARQQYTPQAAPRQDRPVQTTVVNGRTYDRPADAPPISPAQRKATKAFTVLIIVGFAGACMTSFLTLPVCIVLALMIMNAAKKCEGDDTAPVDRLIVVSVLVVIVVFFFSIAGFAVISIVKSLLEETGDLGGY